MQSLNIARGLKFRIQKVEGLYYSCSKNKGADQFAVTFAITAKLICIFVFALTKIRFSHDAAHLMYVLHVICLFVVSILFYLGFEDRILVHHNFISNSDFRIKFSVRQHHFFL